MKITITAVITMYRQWLHYITQAIIQSGGYMTNISENGRPETLWVKAGETKSIPGAWNGKRGHLYFGSDISWHMFVKNEAKKRTQEAWPGYEDEVEAIIRKDYVSFSDFLAGMRTHLGDQLTEADLLNFCQKQYRIRVQGIQDGRCHDATLVVWEEIKRKRR